ncbi:DNA-directed RNA polymerase III subunit RPC1 [Fusarium oxysporum f. sp. albedinis]|nr:DNA-directed RNA polymerase III subunit RPC1 [Fusarium oxysporum f. sp. albedinis]
MIDLSCQVLADRVKEAQRQGSMKEKKIRWNIRLQKKPFAGYDGTLPTILGPDHPRGSAQEKTIRSAQLSHLQSVSQRQVSLAAQFSQAFVRAVPVPPLSVSVSSPLYSILNPFLGLAWSLASLAWDLLPLQHLLSRPLVDPVPWPRALAQSRSSARSLAKRNRLQNDPPPTTAPPGPKDPRQDKAKGQPGRSPEPPAPRSRSY